MSDSYSRLESPFSLKIENLRPIPARDLAEILLACDSAFYEFSGQQGVAHLAVQVRNGSIELVFDVAEKMWDARHLLAPFAAHLVDVAQVLVGHKAPVHPTAADLKAITSISKPVADGSATQINIVNHGIINFTVHTGNAKGIRREAKRLKPKSPVRLRQAVRSAATALDMGELIGTALSIDGRWYGRLLDGEGVIVPLKASDTVIAVLRHDRQFRFRGVAHLGSKRQLIGATIYEAQPVS